MATLPEQLAPVLRAAAEALIAACGEAPPRQPPEQRRRRKNRCVVCGGTGPLGGHHRADGTVVWVHKHCHRSLHRKGRPEKCTA